VALASGVDQNGGTAGFQPDAGSLFAPITLNGNFFSNIQAAHNAAAANDTAVLSTGTYTENVTTTKNLTLQFSGDGTLASGGSLTLGANLSVLGDGSIAIGATVNAGAHNFTVDTQTASGTTINITGPIHAPAALDGDDKGQRTVTIRAAIDPPSTCRLVTG
jgi:hypothetical protein